MLFEEGISLTLLPDSENNINTLIEIIYHQGNSFDIILQICIDRNSSIGMHSSPFQAGPQSLLMTDIMSQLESGYTSISS